MPGYHALVLLLLTCSVFFLYTRAWIRIELVSLLLLLGLLLIFHFFPFDQEGVRLTGVNVFEAFGHPALVAICSLMILARGLTITGALEPAVRLLSRVWRWNFSAGLLLTLAAAMLASGFINDTPVLVLMLPMLLGIAERSGHPATRSLMPVNFAILAGGMLTSIGTSTNLLVLSIAVDLGMQPMGIFDFTPIAALSMLVALPYLWLVAPRLLPRKVAPAMGEQRSYAARLVVADRALALGGRSLAQLGRRLGRALPVVAVTRSGGALPVGDELVLQAGDVLTLNDSAQGLKDIALALKVDLVDGDGLARVAAGEALRTDVELVEVVIGHGSSLVDRTLISERFADSHGVVVVGIGRGTEDLLRTPGALGEVPLAAGDLLLVQGTGERVAELRKVPGLLVLGGNITLPRSPRAPVALAIMAGVVAAAALQLLPIHVAAFVGVVAMLATGCVRLEGMGRALSLEVVLLVASSIALGQALVATGAAAWIAGGVAAAVDGLLPAWQLAAFMAFAALLTNFVSNSAAAAVGTPIAIAAAQSLGQPLEPYVLAVLFGVNLSYATPMAYQTNLLVMSAAGYRFVDFVRVGLPLVILMLGTLSFLLARYYGL